MKGRLLAAVAVIASVTGTGAVAAAAERQAPQVQDRTSRAHDVVVSANPVNWTPHVLDGRVTAFATVGDRVIVGGEFSKVRSASGDTVQRHNIFAYDAGTGEIDPDFAPRINDKVSALAPAPDSPGTATVVVGGSFTEVNGTAARGVVRLGVPSGERVGTFEGRTTNGRVDDLAVRDDWLYIGGTFTSVNGTSRAVLARMDVETGEVDPAFAMNVAEPRAGRLKIQNLELTPSGDRLAIDGTFTHVAGEPRYQLALINTAAPSPKLADWATHTYAQDCRYDFHTYMRGIDFSPDGSYFVVVTTGGATIGTACDAAARWETYDQGTDLRPTWVDSTGGDSLYSVAVTGEAVYVGGHQRWMNNHYGADSAGPGAVSRPGIAALDPVNGMPLTWNPTRTRGVGVLAFLATPWGLLVGSDTERLGHEFHGRVGMFPTAGGQPLPDARSASLPSDLYHARERLRRHEFDGSRAGPGSVVDGSVQWEQARGATMVAGRVYYGGADGELYATRFDGSRTAQPRSTQSWFDWSTATGMFWHRGRLYYTLAGDQTLYYRYFSPQSAIVGSQELVAARDDRWATVRGMTYADGMLFYADTEGNLHRVEMDGGQPVGRSDTLVGGPASDGRDWSGTALFLHNG